MKSLKIWIFFLFHYQSVSKLTFPWPWVNIPRDKNDWRTTELRYVRRSFLRQCRIFSLCETPFRLVLLSISPQCPLWSHNHSVSAWSEKHIFISKQSRTICHNANSRVVSIHVLCIAKVFFSIIPKILSWTEVWAFTWPF